jgi:hypothetical protein
LRGTLLVARQVGKLVKNVSTLPSDFVAFGILLTVGGIYKLQGHAAIQTNSDASDMANDRMEKPETTYCNR